MTEQPGKQYSFQECEDIAYVLGMEDDKTEEFFYHYKAQGWLRANGLPITDLRSIMWLWKRNDYKFADKKGSNKKIALFPIGGNCCKCKLPAVYKSTAGAYDAKYCKDHMPKEVKELYA